MAGISKIGPGDPISEDEKHELLSHLRSRHGTQSCEEAKRKLHESAKRSEREWPRGVAAEQEEAEKKIIVGRAFDPSQNDEDLNPDSDSDRF